LEWADSVTGKPRAELLLIFGNSSSQDFALAAKYVPICKCDKESGPFAVTMGAKPKGKAKWQSQMATEIYINFTFFCF
jgi:hypothetical protein